MRFVRLPEARTGCERRGCVGMSTRICRLCYVCSTTLYARHWPWLLDGAIPSRTLLDKREEEKKISNKKKVQFSSASVVKSSASAFRVTSFRCERRSYLQVLDRRRLLGAAVDYAGKRDRWGREKWEEFPCVQEENFGGAYQPHDSGLIQSGTER